MITVPDTLQDLQNYLLLTPSTFFQKQDLGQLVDLYAHLNKLKSKQPLLSAFKTHPTPSDFKAFESWITKNGVDMSGMELKQCDFGTGVFASKNIDTSTKICTIPRHLMIVSETIDSQIASDPLLTAIPSLVLILKLMIEANNKSSFFAPYIKILPRSFTIPMFRTPQEIALLKGTSVMGMIIFHLDSVIKDMFNMARQYIHISLFLKVIVM